MHDPKKQQADAPVATAQHAMRTAPARQGHISPIRPPSCTHQQRHRRFSVNIYGLIYPFCGYA